MARKTGKVIKREAEIRNGAIESSWIRPAVRCDGYDIAHAALEMGYELGDCVRYKIIIEPKR